MKKRIRKEETEEQEQMVSVTQEELTALRGRPDITQEEYENLLVAQTRLNTIENNTKSWCSGCQTNHSSWAKHYEAKCWNCNKWSLVPNDSLIPHEALQQQDFFGEGAGKIMADFGIDIDLESKQKYPLVDLEKLIHWNDILERNKSKIDIKFKIKKMIFFSAWWNNNLLIVINGENGRYNAWLLVYEMPSWYNVEFLEKFVVVSGANNLQAVELRALEAEQILRGENPILFNESADFKVIYNYDYNENDEPLTRFENNIVKEFELPLDEFEEISPDYYIKPLDIVKIFEFYEDKKGKSSYMVHACIYLGNKKICHVLGDPERVTIGDWKEFLSLLSNVEKIVCYHPMIPFKKPETIVEHIIKSVVNEERYFEINDHFGIYERGERKVNNCESFVNRCVLGLDFSELDDMKRQQKERNLAGLKTLMDKNIIMFNKFNSAPLEKINEVVSYGIQAVATVSFEEMKNQTQREGIKMQSRIETRPINDYKLWQLRK